MAVIVSAVEHALQQAGISVTAQFPQGQMPRLTAAKAAVELRSLQAEQGGFLNYLGITEDPERGPLERYGKKAAGAVLVRICGPDAACVRTAAETALEALAFGDFAVTVEEVLAEETVFDPARDFFYKDLTVRFSALLCAAAAADGTGFLDFKLEGEII